MGTNADFYVGRGRSAQFLGGISMDGYPSAISDDILGATTEEKYRKAVKTFLSSRTDLTSSLSIKLSKSFTDYIYAFDDGEVYSFDSRRWWLATQAADADRWVRSRHK